MEVAVASDHRSPKEVLPVDDQGNLRPACRCLDFIGHLKGKIPHEILLILRGMLTDASILSMRQLPPLSTYCSIHQR